MGLRTHPCCLAELQIPTLSIYVKTVLFLSWMLTDRDHWFFFSCSLLVKDRKIPPEQRWLLMQVDVQSPILCGLPWLCVKVELHLCLMQKARCSHDTQMTTPCKTARSDTNNVLKPNARLNAYLHNGDKQTARKSAEMGERVQLHKLNT